MMLLSDLEGTVGICGSGPIKAISGRVLKVLIQDTEVCIEGDNFEVTIEGEITITETVDEIIVSNGEERIVIFQLEGED